MTDPHARDATGADTPVWDVDEVIDRLPMSRLQITVLVLCALTTILDGFDAQAIGFLASPISDDFHIDLRSFGPTFAVGLFGIMLGTLLLGLAGDRLGRKRALLVSVALVGVFAGLTGFAGSLDQLMVLRFLTGLGLGGAMPNTVALVAEYTPKRLRPFAICLSAASIPIGGMLAGLVASSLLPSYGWRWIFFIGGIGPLAMLVALSIALPESARFLSLGAANQGRIKAIMQRIWPACASQPGQFRTAPEPPRSLPLRVLFSEGRTMVTLLLWATYFMNLLVLYVVVSWLPALLRTAGLPVSEGIFAITCFSLGGVVGSLLQAYLMARLRAHLVLAAEFAIFIALIELLATSGLSHGMVGFAAFAIGWVIQGAQAGLNVFAATFYPTSARTTGIGWGLGIGRLGSILGPLLGGAALLAGRTPRQILAFGAVPALLALTGVLLTATFGMSRLARAAQAEPAMASPLPNQPRMFFGRSKMTRDV